MKDMQKRVDEYIDQFVEGYFDPMTLVVRLTEEVGELAREVNHLFGPKAKKPDEPDGEMAMEMGDILFVLICLANSQGIDLQEAFHKVMEKYETRDKNRWTRKAKDE